MDPALQLFQLSQHSPAWMDGGDFFVTFKERLNHSNIVVDHENISNTFPLCRASLIYPSSSVQVGEEEEEGKQGQEEIGRH